MQRIANPTPLFTDTRGQLMDGGQIYVGVANGDPQDTPLDVFFDSALTIPASQPIRTLGGQIVNGTNPANIFIAENDYSIRILDRTGVLVSYAPSAFVTGIAYQPLDSDLSAIAALSTTAFGRALLTLATQADLQNAAGVTPFAGGSVTTALVQAGAGGYLYASGGTAGSVMVLPTGSTTDTSTAAIVGYY